jgi:peptidoglycan L-alanyl-D-glutamate endopeptidase CwlK
MPKFGKDSLAVRGQLHPDLQRVVDEVIKYVDIKLVEGFRGRTAQNIAFAKGNSEKQWPLSNHNKWPSYAVDAVPFPVDWSDKAANLERYVFVAGVFHTVGIQLSLPIRWGGDWNSNNDMRDENFRDRDHFELLHPRELTTEELTLYGTMPS